MRALFVLLFVFPACSSGGSGNVAGGSFDYCAAKTNRANSCETGTVDQADCKQEQICYDNAIRAEDRDGILRCVATRACNSGDDRCIEEPAKKYATDPTVSAFITSCNGKRMSCGGGFTDDFCSILFGVLSDAARTKIKACIDLPCAEVGDCFDAAMTSLGCD